MDNTVTVIKYRNSRDNMGKLITKLQRQYKTIPEGDDKRLTIQRKIETLKIIRAEMKILINALD